jgi:hypothetical protein
LGGWRLILPGIVWLGALTGGQRLPADRNREFVSRGDQLFFQARAFETAPERRELSGPNLGTFHGHLLARTSVVKSSKERHPPEERRRPSGGRR